MLSESTLVKMPHIVGNHMSWLLLFWIRIVFHQNVDFFFSSPETKAQCELL